MKRIILILGLAASIGLMGTGSVHAQFVVHDPGHTLLNSTEWIANVKKWVTQINEMIDAQELRLGLQKIDQLKELKSLKELADLLDETGALRSYETLLELYEGDTQVQAVAAAVEEGAKDAGLFSPMPEGFAVRSVWLDEPVCYVNLSSAVLRDLEDLEAVPLALQALARSLCSLDTVKEVQFLVDGEYADWYASAPVREPYVYTK